MVSALSGLQYPNKFGRIILESLEQAVGRNSGRAVLRLAEIGRYANRLPSDDLVKGFDFAEVSSIGLALERMYGPRAGRGVALKIGSAIFDDGLRAFVALNGTVRQGSALKPDQLSLKAGLGSLAELLNNLSDQVSEVQLRNGAVVWRSLRCACCWGRIGETEPVCHIVGGLLVEAVAWISGHAEFHVEETACVAMGSDACEFVISAESIRQG